MNLISIRFYGFTINDYAWQRGHHQRRSTARRKGSAELTITAKRRRTVDLAVQSNFFKLWSDPFHFDSPGIQPVSALGKFLTALFL